MRLHYKGKFSGDPADLPPAEHIEESVQFIEPESIEELGKKANILALIITIPLIILVMVLKDSSGIWYYIGLFAPLLTLFPHEIIHALCFKEDVYMYTALSKGMLFVYGTELMTKTRFIVMSIMPTFIFGIIPLLIFFFTEGAVQSFFGAFGAISMGMGAGDFINIKNAATQVPPGGKVYMDGFHTFWIKQ